MASDRVETVRRAWDAYNRGDLDAFLEAIDPDAEFHEDPAFPEAGVYRGRQEIRAYIEQFRSTMAEHRFEVEEIREVGDAVVALLHETARGKASGLEFDLNPAFVYRFRGDKVIWGRAYLDRAKALEDAERGLARPPGSAI